MRCMVPQSFAIGGNRSYPEFWIITDDLQYPGYETPVVTTEPSVEWVVGADLSTVGRIGTHMLLWEPLWDPLVRLWG
jgi:hypothetical protein